MGHRFDAKVSSPWATGRMSEVQDTYRDIAIPEDRRPGSDLFALRAQRLTSAVKVGTDRSAFGALLPNEIFEYVEESWIIRFIDVVQVPETAAAYLRPNIVMA